MSHRETASERAYAPYRKHPQLFGDTFRDEWLHPDMQEMMKRLSDNVTATTIQQEESTTTFLRTLSPLLREEARQIYSFECLSPSFLELFREELNHFSQITEQYNIPVNRPNSSTYQHNNETGKRKKYSALSFRVHHSSSLTT
jgi:hypothetical protein